MDGASVIGLIAATIEVANFAISVVQRLKSFVEATEDEATEGVPKALQLLHRRLPLLSLTLRAIQEQLEQEESLSAEVPELSNLLKPCSKELANLKGRLEDLLPKQSDNRSTKLKKALKSLHADSKIQKSVDIISSSLSDLTSYNSARAISKNNQKTDRILELSVRTASATSQLQQTAVALASKPSFLRDQLDSTANRECGDHVIHNQSSSLLPPRRHTHIINGDSEWLADGCSCPSIKPKTIGGHYYHFQIAAISHEISNPHRPTCHLYYSFRTSRKTSIRLRLPEFLLQRAIDLLWTCKYGAGGFSISSTLDLKGVIRVDSPVADLINEHFGNDNVFWGKAPKDFDGFCAKLLKLFQEGKASPTELNTRGQSIAFACLECMAGVFVYNHEGPGWLSLLVQLWRLGVPLNERSRCSFPPGREPMTCLDHLLSQMTRCFGYGSSHFYISMASLVDSGAQLSPASIGIDVSADDLLLMRYISDYAEIFNCSKLHLAILARSSHEVDSLVRANVSSLRERTPIHGLQALHLASNWPQGTKMLLDLGANPGDVDEIGYPPLHYAIRWPCSEVVNLLLIARSPLSCCFRGFRHKSLVGDAAYTGDKAVYGQMIQALATRRKELILYAHENLPKQLLQDLHVDEHTVPDLEATEIFRHLLDRGHQIDAFYFGLSDETVYQSHKLGGQTMQITFDAGFSNIDGPIVKGKALSQIIYGRSQILPFFRNPSGFLWWKKKGVDLTRPVSCLSLRDNRLLVIHRFSMELGGYFPLGGPRAGAELLREVLQVLLSPKYKSLKDSCQCLCGPEGCTPWTNFLKVFLQFFSFRSTELPWYSEREERYVNIIVEMANKITYSENGDTAISALIRIFLFKALNLRHLCCRDIGYFISGLEGDEADEIKEEDKYLAEEFHILLPKAIQEWEKSTLSFRDFWIDFEKQHIRQKREKIDWEHVEAVQDTGVRIEAI